MLPTMKKTLRLILILAACLPATVSAQLPDEALKCFQWFSTLGYPDVKEAWWAEFWIGTQPSGDEKVEPWARGFVTKETETAFTFVKPDLTSAMVQKSKPGTPVDERVECVQRPFHEVIGHQLDLLQHPPKGTSHRFGARLSQKAETFFLAYVCWQRGEENLAVQLYQAARLYDQQTEKLPSSESTNRKSISMQEELEIDLGHAAMWDAVLRCGGWGSSEEREPRTALLEAFRRIVRHFPHSEHVERARQTAAMLERMVMEDEQHPMLAQEQIDQLPLDKRIAELVWMLRDQNGYQQSQPGTCNVFETMSEDESPAHQLLSIGYPAAPALIEALTDGRFSRSVGFHRDFYFSHIILTIGDCTQQILSRMSGQTFYSQESTSGYMSNEHKMQDVQKAARRWWDEYQKKGKKQMLVDSIADGKTAPGPLVVQLQAEAPDAVEEAVLRGTQKADSDWLLRQFIQQLGSLKSPAVTRELLKLMKQNEHLPVRLDAAGHLLKQGHPEALPGLLHELESLHPTAGSYLINGFTDMLELLIASGDDRVMHKLSDQWDKRPVDQRLLIVSEMGQGLGRNAIQYPSFFKPRPFSPKAKDEAITLLVHALEDLEACDGMSGNIGEFIYSTPRVCDFALWALHEIDGGQYAFSTQADRPQRDRERITAANVWRTRQQQPPLPMPPPPGPPLTEKDALKIVEIQISPAKGFQDTPLAIRALKLRGGFFGPNTISELMISFAKEPPSGTCGLSIEAMRPSDLTGVTLYVHIVAGDYPKKENWAWRILQMGQAGSQSLGAENILDISLSTATDATEWKSYKDEITEGLKSSPTTAFSFYSSLKASR